MNPGNGARAALRKVFAARYLVDDPNCLDSELDQVLAELWIEGFKIVPLDKSEDLAA